MSPAQKFEQGLILAPELARVSRCAVKRSDVFLNGREVNLVSLPNVIKHCEPL
jgi:hypothetical protein